MKNIRVIARCTNMWWNPINAIKHQLQYNSTTTVTKKKRKPSSNSARSGHAAEVKAAEVKRNAPKRAEPRRHKQAERLSIETLAQDPRHPAYWAEGTQGKGAEKPWRFNCLCKEMCSSYESFRYHPTGAMFECTVCGVWSHTDCMMPGMSLDDIEELEVRWSWVLRICISLCVCVHIITSVSAFE